MGQQDKENNTQKHAGGRPTEYAPHQTVEIKETIITLLAEGKSLKWILDTIEGMPSRPIVYQWLNPVHKNFDKEFFNNYTQAREDSADMEADKIEELVTLLREDKISSDKARVILDAHKWLAGKKKPSKYGTKRVDLTSKGKEVSQQVHVFKIPDNKRKKDE